MSNTPVQEPPAQAHSLGSGQTLPPQPFQPISDPSASKRVCFYKSGDYKFSGHRLVINARTFKTFDALLDALSKKVPLPFGVRTITTPRGIHMVKALDDLHDGASYVCSDRKRVKPLNLDEVNRRQVPWNTTRPFSAGRRRHHGLQFGTTNQVTNRPAKVTDRVAVRTPKRLVVIKNRDPTLKRTIVLQRRTAPTFDALLDYLSQILQFPVLKLFSTDGRRVDGLAALILCSGVVVAAGNEPFRLGNYSCHRTGQMAQVMYVDTVEPSMLQARAQNNKSSSSGRGSRNFSLSSERHIVNQIIQSRNGSRDGHLHHHNGPFETEVNHRHTSIETSATGRVDNDHDACIVPQDDDIEKSFCVNQDGSMTVEMKVHLTIKEEELLHWTTTLSRSSLSKRTACASISESGNSSPDSNNAFAKESSSISEDETKEENHPARAGKGVGFNNERAYEGYASSALGKAKAKTGLKRTPTPGPRHVKKASIESVKTVTESEVRESTLGHYSYMERMTDGETTEEYCIVRHSSSSRPVPKPRKTASAGATNKGSHSSIRPSGVAEVLQIQNNGMEVTETVMHIYESQGCYDNYFANEEYSADSVPLNDSTPAPESKPSTDSGARSSSNDCDIDCSWQPPTTDSLQRQKEEMLSLSSDPITSTHDIINNLSSVTENEPQTATNSQIQERVRKDKTPKSEKKKKMVLPARNKKSSTSTSSSDRKQKGSTVNPSKNSKHSSIDKLSSNTSVGKKNLSSSESAKSGLMSRGAQKPHIKKVDKDEKPRKEQALLVNTENVRKTPAKTQNMTKAAAKDNGHNVNSPSGRPQMKKNMLGILQPKKSLLPGKKPINKPKSVTEITVSSPKRSLDLNESFSMPSLNPSPSDIHQYVENWLEKASPESDPVPYTEEVTMVESEPRAKVVFKIGGDSESDEKTEAQTNLDEYYASPSDALKKSSSCLSVPLSHEQRAISLVQNEQYMRGLCVSMPTVRVDPVQQQNTLRSHKSAEAIGPAINEPSLSTSNILSPKAKITPVMRHLCSSVQCIRGVSDTNTASNLEKSNSLPDFPTQVASVFGSSCKAFLSFLSVMTLRDTITGSALGDGNQSGSPSEAMLMMESLQKISAVDDEEEQRASLTDLRSRASSQFRERWKDFQILRERLESEPLSPRVSETEFALDVVSEGGDVFEDQHLVIDELMEELNMPQDLRAEISSTIQQARSFYPVEESTFVETERNQSDSEEDVEKFVEQCSNETKQSPEPNSCCIAEDITQTEQDDDNVEIDSLKKTQTVYSEQTKMMTDSDNEMDEKEREAVEEDREDVNDREDGDTKEIDDDDGEETEKADNEREEEAEEGALTEERMDQEEWEAEKGSGDEEGSVVKVEEGTEGEVTVDEEEEGDELEEGEKDLVKETEEGLMDEEVQEAREHQSVEDTDEREGVEETEEEGEGEDEVDEEEDEEEKGEEGETEEKQREEIKEAVDEVEVDEGEEEENTEEREQEEAEEADALTEDEEEEAEVGFKVTEENSEEEDMNETVEKKDEREEVESVMDEMEEEEEEEKDVEKEVTEDDEEEMEDVIEKDDVKNAIAEMEEEAEEEEEEEEEEETDAAAEKEVIEDEEEELEEVIEERNEGHVEDVEEKDEEEAKTAVSRKENSEEEDEEEEEEKEQEEEDDGEDAEVKSMEGKVMTDEEEEGEETDKNVEEEEEEKSDGGEESGKEQEKTGNSLEEDSLEEGEAVEEREEDEENESDGLNEEVDQVEEPKDEVEEENASGDADSVADGTDCKNLLAEASYLQQQSSCEEEANAERKAAEHDTESPTKYSSEGQCVDDKGNGTDTVNEFETDKEGEQHEEGRGSLPHPVEISQELLDFVNSALQSSSLIFIYDAQGNVRIEPDNARVIQTKQIVIPKSREDSSYGLKQLPSPSTSDLSDYRPETSESGGYKTQDSVDIVTESGEEASSPVCRHKTDGIANAERANSKPSVGSNSEVLQSSRAKSGVSKSSSGTKASKEDLSYFSAGSSQKLESEAPTETKRCVSQDLTDGVLIDQGRWLLKENHLIRKSPPVSLGMYDNVDTTSVDTGQENNSDDSQSHSKTQHNPLAAISSSELEEMAKPQTPKCTYYNMPHGSDSDPFLDDASVKSGKKEASGAKGRGVRVSPMIDTSKTWANKNGSMSSFASVEFKIPDRKVHPEGESSAVTQPRRTSSGGGRALQAQDSLDALHVRCGQYCPIL